VPVTNRPRQAVPTADDLDLLHRLHDGDRDAFAQLYTRTAPTLTRYAVARLLPADRHSAPDLVHDAFCMALSDPELITADLLAAMLGLTARAVIRHEWTRRHETRAGFTVNGESLRTPTGPVLDPPTVAVTTRPGFGPAFGTLTTLQRQAIELHYLDGYPRDRAAQVMGRSVAAFRDLERRALRRLRDAHTV
jgi:RNA polymerase sigma-70 factor (ECF subfamily)